MDFFRQTPCRSWVFMGVILSLTSALHGQESPKAGTDSKPTATEGKAGSETKPDGAKSDPPKADTPKPDTPKEGKVEIPTPPLPSTHPLFVPLQEAYKAREVLKGVKDYSAIFSKRELIGRKLTKYTMDIKWREEPFSVYLKFLDTAKGREVIYVKGQNNGNLLAHETGLASLVGTVQLAPTSKDAMNDNRYPITQIGIKTLVDAVIMQWETEGKVTEPVCKKYPEAKLPTGEVCVAYESLHPTEKAELKFHITRLWIDKESGLPIRVEQLGFPEKKGVGKKKERESEPPIIEEYTYSKMKVNVKLTDRDFDVRNPAYGFQ